MVLSAAWLGLVPDGEALTRQHRAALAESTALLASMLLDEAQPHALRETLELLRKRAPDLLSIGVRARRHAAGRPAAACASTGRRAAHAASTDAEVVVPIWQGGAPWGQVELRFTPLRAAGWIGHLQDPSLRLSAFVFALCCVLFLGYLRRMLRELDPSRAVPQRVRAAYDTLTEGLIVLDRSGAIVLANKSTSLHARRRRAAAGRTLAVVVRLEPFRRHAAGARRAAVAARARQRRGRSATCT